MHRSYVDAVRHEVTLPEILIMRDVSVELINSTRQVRCSVYV